MAGGKGKSSGGKSSGGKTSAADGQKKQQSHSARAGLQVRNSLLLQMNIVQKRRFHPTTHARLNSTTQHSGAPQPTRFACTCS